MFGLLGSRSSSSKAPALRASDGATARTVRPRELSRRGLSLSLALASLLLLAFAGSAAAATATVNLRTADGFAVLGGSTISNTGPTVVAGDLGLSPVITTCSGFPAPCTGGPGTVTNGTIHSGDSSAASAQQGLTAAYIDAASRPCNTVLTGQNLGGRTLTSGVYCFAMSALLTTPTPTPTLTLNAQGNPNAVFIFQIGSTLTTASNSRVSLVNGAQACNVFWQVCSSATLGTTTAFMGNILASASATANTGATVDGRLLARSAAVTLDSNRVTRARCATPPGTGTTPGTSPDAGSGSDTGNGGVPGDHRGPLARVLHLPGVRQVPARRPGTRRPRTSSVCTKHSFTASVRLRDRSGIRRVRVYVDGKLVRRSTHTRFSLRVNVRGLRVGRHRLTVVARDRAGNRSVTRRHFGRCALAAAAPRFTG
ncbi:MAG: ice-binding family protein [Lapillicoccus sp.]